MNETDFTIRIDTREQTPLKFHPGVRCVRATVPKGDYSIAGLSISRFVVERKSCEDLHGTIWGHTTLKDGTKRENFERIRDEFAAIKAVGGTIHFWITATRAECAAYADYRQALNEFKGFRGNVDWLHTAGRIRRLEAEFGFDTQFFDGPFVMADALVKRCATEWHKNQREARG